MTEAITHGQAGAGGSPANGSNTSATTPAPIAMSEVVETVSKSLKKEQFERIYGKVYEGDENWRKLTVPAGDLFQWDGKSTYVKAGCAGNFALWNEQDLGYLATYVAHYVLTGKLTGKIGETFKAGHLGTYKVQVSDGNKPVVVLGPPLVFTPQNIDKYHF